MQAITFLVSRLAVAFFLVLLMLPGMAGTAEAATAANSTVRTTLLPGGGWAAYSFDYPGDNMDVGITLTYDLVDAEGDQGIILNAYSPEDPPPFGTPMGASGLSTPEGTDTARPGIKT